MITYKTQSHVIAGPVNREYPIWVRVRAITELMAYVGGVTNDFVNVGGSPDASGHMTIKLTVSDPPQVVYLNAGIETTSYSVFLDYYTQVPARSGATIKLEMGRDISFPLFHKDIGGGTVNADPMYNGEYCVIEFINDLTEDVTEERSGSIRGWVFDGFNEYVLTQKAER